jgi:hypothetical protein
VETVAARKPKYSKQVHEIIVEALYEGLFRKHAAGLAGIGQTTLTDWIEAGENGDERYVELALDVNRIEAEFARVHSRRVIAASDGLDPELDEKPDDEKDRKRSKPRGDWKASAWILEKRFALLYGSRAVERPKPLPAEPKEPEKPFSPWPKPSGDSARSVQ